MKLRIVYYDHVARWVITLHGAFATWLTRHQSLQHNIDVYLCPNRSLSTCKGPAWGFFSPGRRPAIVLACRRPKADYLDTFAHEWCEYEKWRDDRARNHRGLQNRVDALVRRFIREYR